MTPMTITCAHCGGHDFEVAIVNLAGNSELRCVRYWDHVEQLGLAEKRQQIDKQIEERHGRKR